jgi:hypothetical protein
MGAGAWSSRHKSGLNGMAIWCEEGARAKPSKSSRDREKFRSFHSEFIAASSRSVTSQSPDVVVMPTYGRGQPVLRTEEVDGSRFPVLAGE